MKASNIRIDCMMVRKDGILTIPYYDSNTLASHYADIIWEQMTPDIFDMICDGVAAEDVMTELFTLPVVESIIVVYYDETIYTTITGLSLWDRLLHKIIDINARPI
jgi:hypothetical protein